MFGTKWKSRGAMFSFLYRLSLLMAILSCIVPAFVLGERRMGEGDNLDVDLAMMSSSDSSVLSASSSGTAASRLDTTEAYRTNEGAGAGRKRREKRKTVTVDTSLGVVLGFEERYTNTFLGVPYAEPPLGTFRYRPPRPKEAWAPSVVKAYDFSNECLQSVYILVVNAPIP